MDTYQYRGFSADIERIAAQWFEQPVVAERWIPTAPVSRNHATSPWWAVSEKSGLHAALKPGPDGIPESRDAEFSDLSKLYEDKALAYIRTTPVAALEKIASDLAYHLKLPVPPVGLYHNEHASLACAKPACLSLVCFTPSLESAKNNLLLMDDQQRAHFLSCLSAMAVFKGWLQNEDPRMENITINQSRKDPAFIDFSCGTLHRWKGRRKHTEPALSDAEIIIREHTSGSLESIQRVPTDFIHDIVHRIPSLFLNVDDKKALVEGLIYRRDNLQNLILRNDHARTFDTSEQGVDYLRSRERRAQAVELELDF